MDVCAAEGFFGIEIGLVGMTVGGCVGVLTEVCGLPFKHFDVKVEAGGQEGTEDGSDPVDPVVAGEVVGYNGGAEGAGGVDGTAGEVDSCVKRILSVL